MVQVNDKQKLIPANRDVGVFLEKLARTPAPARTDNPARLIFSLDATASRAPTWDTASHLQAEMFSETIAMGGLAIQLCFYRGFKQFYASEWHTQSRALLDEMTRVQCLGGHTQIAKVLRHGLKENGRGKIQALVFIGDAMEENPDDLADLAGQLGLMKVPVLIFQEGHEPSVRQTFEHISRLSGGAYAPFNLNSAHQLKELLRAVAVFAAGGRLALEQLGKEHGGAIQLLNQQLKR